MSLAAIIGNKFKKLKKSINNKLKINDISKEIICLNDFLEVKENE